MNEYNINIGSVNANEFIAAVVACLGYCDMTFMTIGSSVIVHTQAQWTTELADVLAMWP